MARVFNELDKQFAERFLNESEKYISSWRFGVTYGIILRNKEKMVYIDRIGGDSQSLYYDFRSYVGVGQVSRISFQNLEHALEESIRFISLKYSRKLKLESILHARN